VEKPQISALAFSISMAQPPPLGQLNHSPATQRGLQGSSTCPHQQTAHICMAGLRVVSPISQLSVGQGTTSFFSIEVAFQSMEPSISKGRKRLTI